MAAGGGDLRALGLHAAVERLRDAPVPRPGFKPEAHQLMPSWDDPSWDVWLMLAGRGTGKTLAASYWIDQLMSRHRGWQARIIAPTVRDARECVLGASGLKAINPKVQWKINEASVFWPNGSRARLYGAFTPEDVERLRAGGNCFARGQRVRGEQGWRPIEELEAGERVWTRDGLRPVVWSGRTGQGTVWELETTGGRRLRATAEHKVWTERGFVALDQLTTEDVLWAWSGSNGMACDGTDGRPATTRTRAGACFIKRSGRQPTVRSPRDTRSITATSIAGTTAWRIWSACRSESTAAYTPAVPMPPSPPRGLAGPPTRAWRRPARSAAAPTAREVQRGPASAPLPALTGTTAGPAPAGDTSRLSAWFVAPGSVPDLAPRLVRDRVRRCTPIASAELFDVTVEGRHEVFCEGILAAQSHVDWLEELAAWPKLDETYAQASFGLRLGAHPRSIVTTTPKPKERLRKLIADPRTRITKASTRDNPHLAPGVRARLYEEYEGTRLGRQELEGELLDDVEGALWSSPMIDPYRVPEAPELLKVVVALDPARTSNRESDLTGIIVVGRGLHDNHGYVLADLSGRYTPQQWAAKAVGAYDRFEAAYVVAETNIAGELVIQQVRNADDRVPVRGVHTKLSKYGRALPLVGLYEQGRFHHVGLFPALENQMYEFTGMGQSNEADDRVDALVVGAAELQLTRDPQQSRGWRVYA